MINPSASDAERLAAVDDQMLSILRRSYPFSDNRDPNVLIEFIVAAASIPRSAIQPPFLEVGTRAGGSALAILEVIREYFGGRGVLITVDPYGDKPHDDKPWTYGAKVYTEMKHLLASYPNHLHYPMLSRDFIAVMDQIEWWYEGERRNFSEYSFIYLDGSDMPETVLFEVKHLYPRLISGGVITIDNTNYFDAETRKRIAAVPHADWEVTHTRQQTFLRRPVAG